MSNPEPAILERLRQWIGLDTTPAHDPLPALIEDANAAASEAWEAVNLSRCRRGEEPVRPPTWDDVLLKRSEDCRES
jgi:hypothetical protein